MKKYIFLFFAFAGLNGLAQVPAVSNASRDSNAVKQLFFAGLREKLSENYNTATASFNKVISMDPYNHAAYFELANASLRADKLIEAEQYIRKAIQLNNGNIWYYRLQAEVYKRTNNMAQLIETLHQLIRLDPDNDAYYFDKANALFLSEKTEESKAIYQEIENKFGPSKELQAARARFLANKETKESDIIKLLEGNQADVKNYLYAAGLLIQKGNYSEALNVLLKAREREPGNFELNLALADVYRKQNNDAASFSALLLAFESPEMPVAEKIKIISSLSGRISQPLIARQATELSKLVAEKNPDNAKALALYADVLYQRNLLKEALVQYQASLKLNEQVFSTWEQIINIQSLLGHYHEALQMGEEALTFYPNQASLYYYQAYALFKTGKYSAALDHLKTVLQLDLDNKNLQAEAYALQGDIYINQNNFSEAKQVFEKAIETAPDHYMIMNNYAYYLALRNEDLSKAARYAETAARALPDDASVCDTYAFILFKQQKYPLAKEWIEKALKNNSVKAGVYLERYGDILYMMGDQHNALEQWKKAREAGNDAAVLNKKINDKKYYK